MDRLKKDIEIMRLLKVTELRHMLAHTNVGDLTLLIRKGESEYTFCLDAVPVDKEQNKELMALYFPPKNIVPQVNKDIISIAVKDAHTKTKKSSGTHHTKRNS